MTKKRFNYLLLLLLLLLTRGGYAQDPNFHIYLCFGQSNMEGQGVIETQDMTVSNRFRVMQAVNCSGRVKGNWYTAVPPLCRCWSGLSPADYFGRTMLEYLPDSIRVGVINVSVAGCRIELFDRDNYQTYVSSVTEEWLLNIINEYNGNPYAYLLDLALQAKEDGVIKGILLHQGESNTGDSDWPDKVKTVYDNLIADLALDPGKVPLLAGEVVGYDQGGICAAMNSIIATLPSTLPNSYVISSQGCTDAADNIHFNSAGYRELGRRYGLKMLNLQGINTDPVIPVPQITFLEAECGIVGENWAVKADSSASNGSYVTAGPGFESLTQPADTAAALVSIPFTADTSAKFHVFARLNCPSSEGDSYWMKMDQLSFVWCNSLLTTGWKWKKMNSYTLEKGEHTLTFCYRENGAMLDKLCISTEDLVPDGKGEAAVNLCVPDTSTVSIPETEAGGQMIRFRTYPNPFTNEAFLEFELPGESYISLKIYNTLGCEMTELAAKSYVPGLHRVGLSADELPDGVYYCILQTETVSIGRKLILKRD
ncbi:MAG: sialate O-acetylesterase [Bacteroidota bacterium]